MRSELRQYQKRRKITKFDRQKGFCLIFFLRRFKAGYIF